MKRFFSAIILFLFTGISCFAQTTSPSFKLFLIGDAGDSDTLTATLRGLGTMLQQNPNSVVIFLGDNCYKKSLLGVDIGGFDGSKVTRNRMMSQLNILREYQGAAYFIPGNHDWWNHLNLNKGIKKLLMEQSFIEDTLRNFKTLVNHDGEINLPAKGAPGPVSKEFNNGKIRIIFIDTYRVMIEEGKNKRHKDTVLLKKFYDDLKDQLTDASAKHQKIIVAGHHPINSKGKHSAPPGFWQKLSRRFEDSNVNSPPYKQMATRVDSLLKTFHRPDLYYVSGHEHSLEYFFIDSLHYIVSGAGSKIDQVKSESCMSGDECLIWNEGGFFEIDFFDGYEKVIVYHRSKSESELKADCLAGCK